MARRSQGVKILVAPLLLTMPLLGGSAAVAAEPQLVLDGLSFFAFEGTDTSALIPADAPIPVRIEPSSPGAWQIVIPAASFDVAPIRYPSGKSVQWKLSESAQGTITRAESGLTCTIQAPLVAYVDGAEKGIPFPLTFTTEQSSRAVGDLVASREGVRLDPESGYLQLVATGLNPHHAATAPGKPFAAVLSGRLLDLPESMKAP